MGFLYFLVGIMSVVVCRAAEVVLVVGVGVVVLRLVRRLGEVRRVDRLRGR